MAFAVSLWWWTLLRARLNIDHMAGGGPPPGGIAPGVLDLLPLTGARPGEALAKARAVLATHPAPFEASVAHQAVGTVLRDFGDMDGATAELRAAARRTHPAAGR